MTDPRPHWDDVTKPLVMERRAHWSDDLIDAVRDAVDIEFDGVWRLTEDSILAVIAAVEDWARWEHVPKGTLARLEQAEADRDRLANQLTNEVPDSYIQMKARALDAEAAIQRVRGLHHFVVDEIETREGPEDVQHCSECGYIPTDEEPCPTIRTLDGAT